MNTSIKIQNYKCFGELTGFEEIKRVNLIIGRNNSGKSSLLDVVEKVSESKNNFPKETWRNINEKPVIEIFGYSISGLNSIAMDSKFQGLGGIFRRRSSGGHYDYFELFSRIQRDLSAVSSEITHVLKGKLFRKLSAERDIVAEADAEVYIRPNGVGISNTIHNFLQRASLPIDAIEVEFLTGLNEIFGSDARFTKIRSQFYESEDSKGEQLNEIYLEEDEKGAIALSRSGSGLKTVICVLANLILVPKIEKNDLSSYVFAFEELENNIHPALLRRLSKYVYKMSVDHEFTYFLTTHSNVLIDQFANERDAQIVHITHEGGESTCMTATTHFDQGSILENLEFRASDLLQANGIVWVEGPSDRIYFNKWIELWSDGALQEGTDYQVLTYGGSLISHFSAEAPNEIEELISLLSVNRNVILIADSDKKNKKSELKSALKRLIEEFEHSNNFCWTTAGREVENYIPAVILKTLMTQKLLKEMGKDEHRQVREFEDFFDYFAEVVKPTRWEKRKVELSKKLVGEMTKENLISILDLDEKMIEVCARIQGWNCSTQP